jgi:hypothetical protein
MRQTCQLCDETETMEHILVHCTATPPSTIWDLAKNTWPHAPHLWPEISIGIILGCGTISPPGIAQPGGPEANQNYGRVPRGATRLLQILLSESAHLIWVLRCERVIQECTHMPSEIRCRWLHVINVRLTNDKIIATN